MKTILLGSVAVAAIIASPAMAADYAAPRRAATFAEPAASWTGFYVGGNIGGVWGNTDPGLVAGCSPAVGSTTILGGVVPNLPSASCIFTLSNSGTTNVSPVTATGTQPFHNHGWEGGGQIGFNYQYQWAVFGVEADIQAFKPKGSQSVSGIYPVIPGGPTAQLGPAGPTPCNLAGAGFAGCQYGFTQNSDGKWLATVRGRVGAVWGNWMFYGTMGVAWAKFDFTSNFADTTCFGNNAVAFGRPVLNGCNVSSASFSQTKAGPVGGFGLSYMLTRNIIASVEYLRVEIWGVGGDVTAINTQGTTAPGTFTGNFHYDTTFIENIVRAKLDFKF